MTDSADVRTDPRPPDARSGGGSPVPRRERRGVSPGLIILAVALVGSAAYGLYAVSVRDASQIPLLASGAAVLGVVFAALALYPLTATWRAGLEARGLRALFLGLVGGLAAMAAAGAIAGAIILFQLGGGRA